MKRVLIFCLVLALIIPALAVCAFAAPPESETYMFTACPEDGFFVCTDVLPDGVYTLKYFINGYVFSTVSSFSLVFGDNPLPEYPVDTAAFATIFLDLAPNEAIPLAILSDGSFSYLGTTDGNLDVHESAYFVLERLSPVQSDSLSDFITSDMLQGVLSQIVSLLPVCLAVLVGYIAIRKGLSWLIRLVSNA